MKFFSKKIIEHAAFPQLRLQTGAPGLFVEHVLPPGQVFSEVSSLSMCLATFDSAGRHLAIWFTPKLAGNSASLALKSNDSDIFKFELPELSDRANYLQVTKLEQYQTLTKSLRTAAGKGAKAGGMPLWGTSILLALAVLASMLLFSSPTAPSSGNAHASAQVSAAPAPAPVLSVGDQLSADEKSALATLVNQTGIELSTGGKPFVVFSDPNCPACRQLEQKLAGLDSSLSPVIVPVSFKAKSKDAVSGVLCSKDVAAAWHSAIGGAEPAESCAAGSAQADANNAAFVALKFDQTPTIVTSTGKVAVGAKDFEGLVRWIKENSV